MTEIEHKAGFVSILGNPNVGKSTLMNTLVGERLSIITAKAQTTRHRIMGIVNGDDFQIVYSDTPGVLTPNYKMQEYMMKYVDAALQDSDILLYMVEAGETKYNQQVADSLMRFKTPVILIINKIDTVFQEQLTVAVQYWEEIIRPAKTCCISALLKINVHEVIEKVVELLPVSPPYFPKEELTDRPMRFFVSEIIREKILLQYKKEIPYSAEIEITEYKEEKQITRIFATVYVERETQKAIILGHKGQAIKELGIQSRLAIEEFIGQKVYLALSVKVQKDWRNDERRLKMFGYGI
ncbi:MAG: GTPase Era [Bacteroidales bacterium]|jgi:GTP-binding protein Era|nr:GTPase Era [Bacteroidales bacterium]